jgi:hypothetical protein
VITTKIKAKLLLESKKIQTVGIKLTTKCNVASATLVKKKENEEERSTG